MEPQSFGQVYTPIRSLKEQALFLLEFGLI
jgi:hypothetical protein